jgi:hypothetical protein
VYPKSAKPHSSTVLVSLLRGRSKPNVRRSKSLNKDQIRRTMSPLTVNDAEIMNKITVRDLARPPELNLIGSVKSDLSSWIPGF